MIRSTYEQRALTHPCENNRPPLALLGVRGWWLDARLQMARWLLEGVRKEVSHATEAGRRLNRPTRAQCALAYVANGDWPPLSLLVLDGLVAGGITSALCIAFGAWIGGAL